ncbi:MAG TPA: nuclear transport factor 2 family protein [Candidatus Sulfotelmatobacter sp.]|nr:nuclear transport factor 2 family protein [Candidatus Sulfotelmatobacter sp.]
MRTCLYAVLFLWVSPAALAQQADQSGTAATIRALEHEWAEGQSRVDARALDLIFDNALVYLEYGSLVSKGEYLARIKRQNPQLDLITYEGTTVRIFGGTALVIGTYAEKRTRTGKTEAQRWRFIDTWAYKNGSWVLIAAGAAPITR